MAWDRKSQVEFELGNVKNPHDLGFILRSFLSYTEVEVERYRGRFNTIWARSFQVEKTLIFLEKSYDLAPIWARFLARKFTIWARNVQVENDLANR